MEDSRRISVLLVAVLPLLLVVQTCFAVPQEDFYLHEAPLSQSQLLQRSSGAGPSYQTVQLSQTARFYSTPYTRITVRK